jgi:hypothetical protein
MSILSLADFNGRVPRVATCLVGTDTVAPGGHPRVDQVTEAGTFTGHARGLSHGHGQRPTILQRGPFDEVAGVVEGQVMA